MPPAPFGSTLIGLTEIPKPEALKPRGGLWFQLGRVELHLGVEEPFQPAKKAHPGILTTEVEQLATSLADAGYEVRWDRNIQGRKRFFTDDPFGNRIEFLQL